MFLAKRLAGLDGWPTRTWRLDISGLRQLKQEIDDLRHFQQD